MKMTLSKRIEAENFNLQQIADSGQCFRMNREPDGSYLLVAGNCICRLRHLNDYKNDNCVEISLEEEKDLAFWENYFHLDYDYGEAVKILQKSGDDFLKKSLDFGRGLRILRQDAFETLISFIISQNKNIPAIKSSIEKLCSRFGEKRCWEQEDIIYFAFPTPEMLADLPLDSLRAAGLGYRDEYVKNAAQAVANGRVDLEALKQLDTSDLMKELMNIKGVGRKVASCVALFGFGKMDAVPVDVWIDRVNKEVYNGNFDWEKHGEIAGLVQQYFFYYMRNKDKYEA